MKRQRRPPASPAETDLVRRIACFINDNMPAKPEPALVVLACVSRAFPNVKLDAALTGYVFREAPVRKRWYDA